MLLLVLTDGKAGDLVPCLGVAEALMARGATRLATRALKPRALFSWAMPWGPADPRDRDAILPPYPDIAIASGRRAVATLRALKKRSPKTFTVFLKDPRIGAGIADLIWVPEHDALRGPNVITSLTAPHRITVESLAMAHETARDGLRALASPRVGVLLGGPSKDVIFSDRDQRRLIQNLSHLSQKGASLMITPSRRTPQKLIARARAGLADASAWLWDGMGENPYGEILALADAFVVTGESTNMVGEAAATGKPIGVFFPSGLPPKILRSLEALKARGAVTEPVKCLETPPYEPLNSTPMIAAEILRRYRMFLSTQKG